MPLIRLGSSPLGGGTLALPTISVYGTIIFNQIQEAFTGLGSFVLTAEASFVTTSTLVVNTRDIVLGPDYTFGIVVKVATIGL